MAIKAVQLAASPEKTKKVAELKKKISDLTKKYNAQKKEWGGDKNNKYVSAIRDEIQLTKRELQKIERHTATASSGWKLMPKKDTAFISRGSGPDGEEFTLHGLKEGGKVTITEWKNRSGGYDRMGDQNPYDNEELRLVELPTDDYEHFVKVYRNQSDCGIVPGKDIFDTLIKHATPKSSQTPSRW